MFGRGCVMACAPSQISDLAVAVLGFLLGAAFVGQLWAGFAFDAIWRQRTAFDPSESDRETGIGA